MRNFLVTLRKNLSSLYLFLKNSYAKFLVVLLFFVTLLYYFNKIIKFINSIIINNNNTINLLNFIINNNDRNVSLNCSFLNKMSFFIINNNDPNVVYSYLLFLIKNNNIKVNDTNELVIKDTLLMEKDNDIELVQKLINFDKKYCYDFNISNKSLNRLKIILNKKIENNDDETIIGYFQAMLEFEKLTSMSYNFATKDRVALRSFSKDLKGADYLEPCPYYFKNNNLIKKPTCYPKRSGPQNYLYLKDNEFIKRCQNFISKKEKELKITNNINKKSEINERIKVAKKLVENTLNGDWDIKKESYSKQEFKKIKNNNIIFVKQKLYYSVDLKKKRILIYIIK